LVDAEGEVVQSVEGFITPWTDDSCTCSYRILADGTEQKDFYPSYLSGELTS